MKTVIVTNCLKKNKEEPLMEKKQKSKIKRH